MSPLENSFPIRDKDVSTVCNRERRIKEFMLLASCFGKFKLVFSDVETKVVEAKGNAVRKNTSTLKSLHT